MKDKLSLGEIKTFVELIDAKAGLKAFQQLLGLTKADVDRFYPLMGSYRKVLSIASEMERVRQDPSLTLQQKLRTLDKLSEQLPNDPV